MERKKLVISTFVCTLLFSYGSVASTHMYSQGVSAESVLTPWGDYGIDFAADTLATIGSPNINGVAEFARQVSGFQHELGEGFGGDQAGEGIDSRHVRAAASQHGIPAQNNRIMSDESGTWILITLGFAALGLSRRRIKFAAFANAESELTCAGESYALNGATAETHDCFTSQRLHCSTDVQTSNVTADDAGAEETTKPPQPVKTTAGAADRNPYPELAQSVQKLEALAREMAHLR